MEGYLLLQYVKKHFPMSKKKKEKKRKYSKHCTRYDSDLLTALCCLCNLSNTC